MSGVSAYSLQSLRVTYTARQKSSLVTTIEKLRRTLEWISPSSSSSSALSSSLSSLRRKSSPEVSSSNSSSSPSKNSDEDTRGSHSVADVAAQEEQTQQQQTQQQQNQQQEELGRGCGVLLHAAAAKAEAAASLWPVPRRVGRRQWRVTYLKSPFKYKYALRHFVFEDYRYAFDFYDVQQLQQILSASLGAMHGTTCCSCRFSWRFSGQPHTSQDAEAEGSRLAAGSRSAHPTAAAAHSIAAAAAARRRIPDAKDSSSSSFSSSSSNGEETSASCDTAAACAPSPSASSAAGAAAAADAVSRLLLKPSEQMRRQQLIRRSLEESQAVERILEKVRKKTRQWYPGRSYWAPS